MMEARKRAASPDSIGPSAKKRIISASDWSKPISVTVQKTEDDDDGEDMVGDQLEVSIERASVATYYGPIYLA